MNPPQLAADYCARVLDPALHIIRARLLQDRPLNVGDYISQFHSQIKSDIQAAACASPAPALPLPGPSSIHLRLPEAPPLLGAVLMQLLQTHVFRQF